MGDGWAAAVTRMVVAVVRTMVVVVVSVIMVAVAVVLDGRWDVVGLAAGPEQLEARPEDPDAADGVSAGVNGLAR